MDTKLPQNSKSTNPLFLEEAGEYLERNGFRSSESTTHPGQIFYFHNSEMVIEVRGDKIEFAAYHAGDDDRRGEYKAFHTVTGIGNFERIDWILLFHITGVVPIKGLVKGIIQEGVRFNPETVLQELFKHFKVTGDREAVPLNY